MSRHGHTIGLFGGLLALTFTFSQTAFAKDPCKCWIDVKTGKRVPSVPLSTVPTYIPHKGDYAVILNAGGRTAFNPVTKQNYALVLCPETGGTQPSPTPGQGAGDTLKKVFDSVHISIGGGYTSGHNERHHGEDRHRTADKVSTDKTKTHTTSPTTTHKTVTTGCKCHPCTCH